ncbi:hypothetical protein NC653_036657 [Populus alba x Populus x berolinensis]|uniref:Uncharacterized protein n=1 Tax=Populus alba x Populus x berolinensis TaxID=444605 RepID=A0AAD6PWQ2_9ROSI|nr:hypothetical protein NC653_036657 [Populus alba x Populus x berolinensis]
MLILLGVVRAYHTTTFNHSCVWLVPNPPRLHQGVLVFQKIYIYKSFLILCFIVFFYIKIYLQNNYANNNFYTFENRLVNTVVEHEAIINLKFDISVTDVIGRVKAMQPLEKILVSGQRLLDKHEFILDSLKSHNF